jgi:UDP-N-acetylmuramate--alanine ligase
VRDGARVDLDPTRSLRVHLVGIGGAGMSAIATVLATLGHVVTGSDLRTSRPLESLRARGVEVRVGHDASAVAGVDVVTRSTAVPDHNVEVVAALDAGIPVLSRAEVLAALTRLRPTLAVAGTHGKTTTSSMAALALRHAGLDPSFIIGGDVNEIGTGAHWGGDDGWFVVEADESDGTFLALDAGAAIVTSVEPDHLEHWGGFAPLCDAFGEFLSQVDGPRIVYADDPGAAAVAERVGALTYGVSAGADVRLVDHRARRTGSSFRLERDGRLLAEVTIPLPGLHNALNATAALVAATELGADIDAVVEALGRFAGVARRFEHRGTSGGVTFVDDYAHLPTEVSATLEAARGGGWDRIVCVFQPHRFSRTETLAATFADAFGDADRIVVTDVYGAGEKPRPGVTGKLIVDAVLDAHPHAEVAWLPHRGDLTDYLTRRLRPGDLCLTLGAGDLPSMADFVAAHLERR